MSAVLLLVHAAATWYMAGLIWFVQVVHYPLAARVGSEAFVEYQRAHMSQTSLAVGPPMLIELVTAGLLVVVPPPGVPLWAPWLGAALLGGVWLSTALFQVPLHRELGEGRNAERLAALVRTNWLRTIGWSLRGALALVLVAWAWTAR